MLITVPEETIKILFSSQSCQKMPLGIQNLAKPTQFEGLQSWIYAAFIKPFEFILLLEQYYTAATRATGKAEQSKQPQL